MRHIKFLKYLFFIIVLLKFNITHSSEKIYYLDLNFIMNNSLAGKSIIKQINKKNTANLERFTKQEIILKKEENKLIAQKKILDGDKYGEQVKIFRKKISDYKSNRNLKAEEISKKMNNGQAELTNTLTAILADYASKNSINYIIPKKNIIIGKSELDLTNTILKILDAKTKNIKIK